MSSPRPHDFEPEPDDFNPDPDTLCPNCVADVIDSDSFHGWCTRCTEKREKDLKSARQHRWAPEGWRRKLGATG